MDEFRTYYEDTLNKTEQTLADDMGVDLEYASLIVPTMVICKNFIDILIDFFDAILFCECNCLVMCAVRHRIQVASLCL